MLAGAKLPVLVLAAPDRPGAFPAEPGGALTSPDRVEVRGLLPPGCLVVIAGRHCLHRDAVDCWLGLVTGFGERLSSAP